MCVKIKRCGYCGSPIDDSGNLLSIDECNKLTEDQLNDAELGHGNCCLKEQQEHTRMTITKDMATDAGDPSLEGMLWDW